VAAAELGRGDGSAVIIVTTKAPRRARALWRGVSSARRAIARAAVNDPFEPSRWWHNTHDVVREFLGPLNV